MLNMSFISDFLPPLVIRDRCFKRRLKVCLPSIKVAQHGIQCLALRDELLALLLDFEASGAAAHG